MLTTATNASRTTYQVIIEVIGQEPMILSTWTDIDEAAKHAHECELDGMPNIDVRTCTPYEVRQVDYSRPNVEAPPPSNRLMTVGSYELAHAIAKQLTADGQKGIYTTPANG